MLISIALLTLMFIVGCQTQSAYGPIALSRLTDSYWQIWTMKADGSNIRQVTTSPSDKRYPVWAEDGGKLLFRTNNNHVLSVDLDTSQENRLMDSFGLSGGIVPSPDGSKLVVVRYRNQPRDSSSLWLTTSGGKDSRMLTSDAGMQYGPCWSPDGKQIIYVDSHGYRTAELYIINPENKNKQRLTNNKARELLPVFSPDGKTIAYTSDETGNYEIWLMDPEGGNRRQITNSGAMDTRPFWSPDGSKIMFASNRGGELQIWIMNSDGSDPKQLTTGSPCMDPTWRK